MSFDFGSIQNFIAAPNDYVLKVEKKPDGTQCIKAEEKGFITWIKGHCPFINNAYKLQNVINVINSTNETNIRSLQQKDKETLLNFNEKLNINIQIYNKKHQKEQVNLSDVVPRAIINIQRQSNVNVERIAQATILPEVPPQTRQNWNNKDLVEQLKEKICQGQQLPGAFGTTKMTGEEHINAILYQQLIENKKRNDVVIVPLIGNSLPDASFNFPNDVRFVVVALSINNNQHNTVLVIDRENKEFHYFDSLGGQFPENIKKVFEDKNLIPKEYKQGSVPSTKQTDGWSCGFHAVENAVMLITQTGTEQQGKPVAGETLRNKYQNDFVAFAKTNGKTDEAYANDRLNRRRKMRVRDALKGCTDPGLKVLHDALISDLHPDSATKEHPFHKFRDAFLEKYQHREDLAMALHVLQEATDPSGSIYQLLPATLVGEDAEDTVMKIKKLTEPEKIRGSL